MTTFSDMRQLASRLAASVVDHGELAWPEGARELAALDGRDWLLLDQAARAFHYADGVPLGGTRGWLAPNLGEPTGFVAATTSLHVDGRIRERASRALGAIDTPIANTALSVRLLDHVPQVRAAAWAGLRPRVSRVNAEAILDVLLAGRGRFHASEAINSVRGALLDDPSPVDLVRALTASTRRRVRRWAYALGHEQGLLTDADLVAAARTDPDQFVRAVCADWLMASPNPEVFRDLLDAGSVEARLVALTKVPDAALSERSLGNLLTDRAPRVREQARWRARRRGVDLASFYRDRLRGSLTEPRVRAACLDALALVGDNSDLETCAAYLSDAVPRVRAAAVSAVLDRARPEDATKALTPLLLDPSPRVCTAAAKGLARLGAPRAIAEPAWKSAQPWSRRAGWRLARAAGGWDRVEADLRAACDDDQGLAGLGRSGVGNWVQVGAATTYQRLSDDQRDHIHALLTRSTLDDSQQRMVAFCAGIKLPPRPRQVAEGEDDMANSAKPRRRFGFLRPR